MEKPIWTRISNYTVEPWGDSDVGGVCRADFARGMGSKAQIEMALVCRPRVPAGRVALGNLKPIIGDYSHNLLIVLASYGLGWGVLVYLRRQRIFLRL